MTRRAALVCRYVGQDALGLRLGRGYERTTPSDPDPGEKAPGRPEKGVNQEREAVGENPFDLYTRSALWSRCRVHGIKGPRDALAAGGRPGLTTSTSQERITHATSRPHQPTVGFRAGPSLVLGVKWKHKVIWIYMD